MLLVIIRIPPRIGAIVLDEAVVIVDIRIEQFAMDYYFAAGQGEQVQGLALGAFLLLLDQAFRLRDVGEMVGAAGAAPDVFEIGLVHGGILNGAK
jgi:hypothetical protein